MDLDAPPQMKRTATFFLLAGLAAAGCSASSGSGEVGVAAAPAPPETAPIVSVWDGVYTETQADQGEQLAVAVCFVCHVTQEWRGLARAWSGRPLGELYQLIRRTMPNDDPGSLSREEYAAVVAYILKLNGAVAGPVPLPSDDEALGRVQIAPR